MRRAVCPGSFDPVTNGHLDIITRASRLYDEVIVAVLVNQSKSGLFSHQERLDMLGVVTGGLANVRVAGFAGLLVDFCRAQDAVVVIERATRTAVRGAPLTWVDGITADRSRRYGETTLWYGRRS